MTKLFHDLRYGLRMLARNPGFTAIAVITLALGIGANTAIFSVVNAVLLRPLPYPEPQRLVTMRSNQSLLDVVDIKAQSRAFEEGGGVTVQSMDYTGGVEPLRVHAGLVNAGLFKVLGVQPEFGRTLSPEEDTLGGPRSVVLSHAFWEQQFGADRHIMGKTIPLSGNSYAVIGVMPAGFVLPEAASDMWMSLRIGYPEAAAARGVHFLRTYWRLKPGVGLAQAQAEMGPIDRRLAEQYPAEDKGRETSLIPLQDRVVGNTRTALLVLFGAVGLVLLIACTNFASLLLARAVSRQQEIVIRVSLGARRSALVRQMLTESLLLALLGGTAGLVLAEWGIDLLMAMKPAQLARLTSVGIDLRVLLFTLAISVLTGLLFGLAPAWSAVRTGGIESLKEGGRGTTAGVGSHRLRSLLVVSELALAMVLLVGASLLMKTFWRLRAVDPGFDPQNILTMQVQLPATRYAAIPKQTQFRQRVLEGLNSLPGVEASMVSEVPLGGEWVYHNFIIEGRVPVAEGNEPELGSRSVMGDYFHTMRIPLRAGRNFAAQDREGSPLVGIVNEAMVRQFFPHQDPIGVRIRWARQEGPPKWFTIIGVAADVKFFGLDRPEAPAIYWLYSQSDQPWKRWMSLVIRSRDEPATLVARVKKEIGNVDNQIPVSDIRPLAGVMAASIAQQRFNMLLLSTFAAVALLLAAVGIYGVISYSVTRRTHEIGIRMALGAGREDVLRLVVREGMLLALLSVVVGLALALGLTRVMSSLLFGVRANDPVTFVIVSFVLAGVALLASYIPARRATRVDPMVALRYE